MTNAVEGVVEKIHKGKEYTTQRGGQAYSAFFEIKGIPYKQAFILVGNDIAKEGDTVKFQFEDTFDKFTNMPIKLIVKGTFQNISNPQAASKKSGGGNWKPRDPEEQIRIANQSQIKEAISILIHNSQGKIIKLETVKQIAAELVEFVYMNKPTGFNKAVELIPSAPTPAAPPYPDVPPAHSYSGIPENDDEDVPF